MDVSEKILQAYSLHWREHGTAPQSIYRFCQDLEISEKDFFNHFSSFEAVDSTFWKKSIDDVIWSVSAGPEFPTFNSRQQLITFTFAFLEKVLETRSLFLLRFGDLSPVCKPCWLQGFEASFLRFAERSLEHGKSLGEVAERGRLAKFYPNGLYLAFRSILQFNLKDTSPGFERTDAFVEKTYALAFDLLRTQALDSAFDLARFLNPCSKAS
jgi:hypothetical protein